MKRNYSFFIKAGSLISTFGLFSNFSASAFILNDFKKFFCDEILDYFYTMKAVSSGENFFKENKIKDQLDIEKYILCSIINRSLNFDYFLAILNILPEKSDFKIKSEEDFCNYIRVIVDNGVDVKKIDDKKFKKAEQEIKKANEINVRTEFLNFFNEKNQNNFYYESSSLFGIKEKLGSIYYLLRKQAIPLKSKDLDNFDRSVFKNIFEKFLEIKEKIFTKTSNEILGMIKIDENEVINLKNSFESLEKDIKERIEFYYENKNVDIKNFKEDFFKILEKFKYVVLLVGDKIRNQYGEILGIEEKTKNEEVFYYEKYVATLSKILSKFPELNGKIEFENKYGAAFSLKVPEYRSVKELNIVDMFFKAKTHLQRSKINEEFIFKIKNSIKELEDKYNQLINAKEESGVCSKDHAC